MVNLFRGENVFRQISTSKTFIKVWELLVQSSGVDSVNTMAWLLQIAISLTTEEWIWIIRNAIGNRRYRMLSYLLKQWPGKFVHDDYGTVLHRAAQLGDATSIKIILDTPIPTTLSSAETEEASIAPLPALRCVELERSFLDTNDFVNAIDYKDRTALQAAIRYWKTGETNEGDRHETIICLTHAGALLDHEDRYGYTVLIEASEMGILDLVQLLIREGASVDYQNKDGYTACSYAAMRGQLHVVKYLNSVGASIDLQTKGGSTALSVAAQWRSTHVVNYLLDHQASIHVVDDDDNTPLHCAALGGNLEFMQYLVAAGSSLLLKNKHGSTALSLAAESRHIHMVNYLLDHHASIYTVDDDGDTPLHCAALGGYLEMVQSLDTARSSLLLKNKRNETPADAAERDAHHEVAQWLMEQMQKSSECANNDSLVDNFCQVVPDTTV